MELRISGNKYDFFIKFDVKLSIDAIASTFSFSAFFDPDSEAHKSLFKPLSGRSVEIYDEGVHVLSGVILGSKFSKDKNVKMVSISGYSKTGILEDCNIPTELYPLESNNLSLVDIAKRICKKFGISVIVSSSASTAASKVYEKTSASESESIKSYLSKLANERNLVLTHTEQGNLLITKISSTSKSVWNYNGTDDRVISISHSANAQGMHSKIDVVMQASIDSDNAGEETINNPFISQYRPAVKKQSTGDENDTSNVGVNTILSELKNIKLSLSYQGMKWNDEIKIKPGQIITVQEPYLYLYNPTRFIVSSVSYEGDNKDVVSTVDLVLPEIYSGKLPTKSIY